MDLHIYNSILKESGIDPLAFDKKKQRHYANGERAFRHDILENKVNWTNEFKHDYYLFIACYHPLLGLFLCPRYHPYTRKKRLMTLIMMLCVGSFFATMSAFVDANFESDGAEGFFTWLGLKLVASICNGVILTFMELMLRLCLQCKCRENVENQCCNNWCKFCTKLTFGFWAFMAFVCLIAMFVLVILERLFSGFIVIFIMQFMCSWLLQCLGLLGKFSKLWKKDNNLMKRLPPSDPYNQFGTTAHKKTFKELLKDRKKAKYPYYVTYFDQQQWIKAHPEYEMNKRGCCKKVAPKQMVSSVGSKRRIQSKEAVFTDDEHMSDHTKSDDGGLSGKDGMKTRYAKGGMTLSIDSTHAAKNSIDGGLIDLSDG